MRPPSSRPQVRLRWPTYLAPPRPVGDSPLRPLPPPRPAGGLLPASPSQQPARAGGRDRHRRAGPGRAARPPSLFSFTAAGGPGPRQDLPGRRSNPLLATAAAEAAGKRRGGLGGPELRRPTRARGGARPFPPPPPPGAMGWEEKQVRGYPEFVQTAQRYHGRPIFALFCGDKDAEGRSWCPDCVTGEARGAGGTPRCGGRGGRRGGRRRGGGAPVCLGPRRAPGRGGAAFALSPAGTSLMGAPSGRLPRPAGRRRLFHLPEGPRVPFLEQARWAAGRSCCRAASQHPASLPSLHCRGSRVDRARSRFQALAAVTS